ncbi:MAG: YdcF family protein [Acidimicrobiales bacterium]
MIVKWCIRAALAVVALGVLYAVVTALQVWMASRRDQARPVQAIVVLGAAQYNGVPSPDLAARLNHAYDLWHRGLAPTIVVTGGKEPGDSFTEAAAGATYLAGRGVPQAAILREVSGRNSWQSLESTAGFLEARGDRSVLLVSDPYHDLRISLMSLELGLTPYMSPTRSSPLGWRTKAYNYGKETGEVALGRIIGFRRLVDLDTRLFG